MAMEANTQLKDFLSPYQPSIQQLTLDLRDFLIHLVPEANELIWDNYNAVALAYSKSEKLKDAFCHIAVYSKHVNFGFNRGTELKNPGLPLIGKGQLIRHIKVTDWDSFPVDPIQKMVFDAVGISESRNPTLLDKKRIGKSIIMSVSEKKRRP